MMNDDAQRLEATEYIADMTCLLAKGLCKVNVPLYGTLKREKRHKRYDDRSAEDIIGGIIAKRRKKRGIGGEKT